MYRQIGMVWGLTGLLFIAVAVMMGGCKTAQKTESSDWHYNMGKQDAEKQSAVTMEQSREQLRVLGVERDDVKEGWRQCEQRLSECLEADKNK